LRSLAHSKYVFRVIDMLTVYILYLPVDDIQQIIDLNIKSHTGELKAFASS
jgi:hypothetical protein